MSENRKKLEISGLLLIDKPLGFTSNQTLSKIKWIFSAKKAGHTGTLDPLATGLFQYVLVKQQNSQVTYSIQKKRMKPQ